MVTRSWLTTTVTFTTHTDTPRAKPPTLFSRTAEAVARTRLIIFTKSASHLSYRDNLSPSVTYSLYTYFYISIFPDLYPLSCGLNGMEKNSALHSSDPRRDHCLCDPLCHSFGGSG